jgi:hypothetical protein
MEARCGCISAGHGADGLRVANDDSVTGRGRFTRYEGISSDEAITSDDAYTGDKGFAGSDTVRT